MTEARTRTGSGMGDLELLAKPVSQKSDLWSQSWSPQLGELFGFVKGVAEL